MKNRIIDFLLKHLLASRYPHLVGVEGVEDGAYIIAMDAGGCAYEYIPALGIFDPEDVGPV